MKKIIKISLIISMFLILSGVLVISARQPIVDGDNNNWGTILNEYLNVSHTENGTLKKGLNASFYDLNVTNQFMYLGAELNLWIMTRFVNVSWTNITYDSELAVYQLQIGAYNLTNFTVHHTKDSHYGIGVYTIDNGTLGNTSREMQLAINQTYYYYGINVSGALNAYDLLCTNCIGTTEITDDYLLNIGDTLEGNLIIDGNLTILGDEIIANVTTQKLNGSFLPQITNVFDIGSPSSIWANIYATILYGSLGWKNLTDYPSACTTAQVPTTFGDTLTCSAISITESQISDLSHTTDTTVGNNGTIIRSGVNESWARDAVNQTYWYYNINVSGALNAYDLQCTNCIGGTEIAELADADISDTLTCSNMEGTDWGTLTDAKWCVYDQTGTEVDCNVNPVTDTTIGNCSTQYSCSSTVYAGNTSWVTGIVNVSKSFWDINVSGAINAYDLQCTNCIGGTEIAELADADISDTLTCSDLQAGADVDIGNYYITATGFNATNWNNVTITESQISDLSHTTDTTVGNNGTIIRSGVNESWARDAVNQTYWYYNINVSGALNAYDLQCTNCIGGTEIAELADADISDTLTCSDLQAGSSVVEDSEVDDDITIATNHNITVIGSGLTLHLDVYNSTYAKIWVS